MVFEGREIPKEKFKEMARRIFRDLLAEMHEEAARTKTTKWLHITESGEQQMFTTWLESLGVQSFPLWVFSVEKK